MIARGGARKRLPIDFGKLRIPIEREGVGRRLSLDEASVEEIQAATRKLQRGAQRPHPKASPVVVAVARALSAKRLRGISVRFAAGKLSLGAIPVAAIGELGRASSARN
jgi:hypothetical protein